MSGQKGKLDVCIQILNFPKRINMRIQTLRMTKLQPKWKRQVKKQVLLKIIRAYDDV